MALNDGLKFGSHFDNGTAIDWSGNGNDGTNVGATATTDKNNIANKALSFDGSTSVVKVPDLGLTTTGGISYSIWLNTTSIISNKWLVNLYCEFYFGALTNPTGTGLIFFNLFTDDSRIDLFIPNAMIFDGNWHMITHVYDIDNNNIEVYCDGISVDSASNSLLLKPRADKNNIGGSFDNPNWTGKFDEPRVWNRALSATEILEVYNLYDLEEEPTALPSKALFFGSDF